MTIRTLMKKFSIITLVLILAVIGLYFWGEKKESTTRKLPTSPEVATVEACLQAVNKSDPLGIKGPSTEEEKQKRMDCFSKYPSADANPLNI